MLPTKGRHSEIQRLLVGAVWLSTGQALAQSHGTQGKGSRCEHIQIRVKGALEAPWLEQLSQACTDLAAIPDADRTASVLVSPRESGVEVEVTLSDGRSVTRSVRTPKALAGTLEALLTVPGGTRPRPSFASDATGADLDHEIPGAKESAREEERRGGRLGLELGGSLGARALGDGPIWAISSGVHAEVRRRAWLVGISLRWDTVPPKVVREPPDFEMDTFSMGTTVARRFPSSLGQLDVGVAPRVAFDGQTAEVGMGQVDGARWDLRLGAFGRLRIGGASTRLRIELDGEISPRYLRHEVRIDPGLPPLPAWTAGLAVGISWGTP